MSSVIYTMNHRAVSGTKHKMASQSFHRNLSLFPASEMKSAATKDVSVLSQVPALGLGLALGGSRTATKLRLAPRAAVALSGAAISKVFISAGLCGSRYIDLPMRRATHPCLACLTAIATASVDRPVSRNYVRSGGIRTSRRRHSSSCRIVNLR